ncbi:heavy metal translocating P-type ATPase [Actinomyces trachealis]|uniref:heavy metal translocating P-type ATPase n=1 Tax=Actinomyces trachealis TaxID=2763540 RepID=UPI001892A179|nr:heavy metal translocating P-type ATPase [Actinomyces trachealis]
MSYPTTPAGTPDAADTTSATRVVSLAVSGMTCASCVARVEKKLSRLDGVQACVNLATESAQVTAPATVSDEELLRTVAHAGYSATITATTAALPETADEPTARGTRGAGGSQAQARPTAVPQPAPKPLGAAHLERAADLRRRLLICLVLSVPVMALSMVPALQLPGWQWVVFLLTLPVATWGAWPFHRAAAQALRHRASTMDTLVSLGVLAAFGWSVWALVWGGAGQVGLRMSMELLPRAQSHHPHLYFESAAWVTTFLLAGRLAEARAKFRSGDALRALLELGAKEVTRVRLVSPSGSTAAVEVLDEQGAPLPEATRLQERVAVEALVAGDLFAVSPGEKVATDGVVVEGRSAVDASLLTGESVPVEVGPGAAVTGATVNTSGALLVRATAVGEGTTLARIGALVTAAQAGKAPVQRLADRVSGVFVPAVISLAALTLVGWLVTGHAPQQAFTAAVAVLVIACPCALGLATPTAVLVGTGRAAQLGVVVKGPEVLESTRTLDTIVLDKTGTVTQGRMSLGLEGDLTVLTGWGGGVPSAAGGADTTLSLTLAGAVEAPSEHPVAAAVAAAAREAVGDLPPVGGFTNHAGRGVSGTVALEGRSYAVAVGRAEWLAEEGTPLDDAAARALERAEETGATAIVLAVDGEAAAVLAVRDTVRPSSAQAVARLRDLGLRPVLLTGDNPRAAAHVARAVGIAATDVHAGVLPGGKQEVVAALQAQGHNVGMVGDGVNDAAALAQASTQGLGLAMGTGADVAIETADITLMRADLDAVVCAVQVSRATLRVIRQNLFWAFAYNVSAIPLAVAGLLNPMIAGAAMACSSVIVVLNSLRLRRAGG